MTESVKTWKWYDHNGAIVSTPATEMPPTTFGKYDRLTHWMFGAPSEVATFQALTFCGRRAGEIPGRGAVDCPECIEEGAFVPRIADWLASQS